MHAATPAEFHEAFYSTIVLPQLAGRGVRMPWHDRTGASTHVYYANYVHIPCIPCDVRARHAAGRVPERGSNEFILNPQTSCFSMWYRVYRFSHIGIGTHVGAQHHGMLHEHS